MLVWLFLFVCPAFGQVWGSFDNGELYNADWHYNLLSGTYLDTLRRLILETGSIEVTSEISGEFLDTIDVFFTSRPGRYVLEQEQTALLDWVNDRTGIVVISGDDVNNAASEFEESFARIFGFAEYGFPHWGQINDFTVVAELPDHPLLDGVSKLRLTSGSGFHVPDEATYTVVTEMSGIPFLALLETASGGIVLVIGDWDIWSGNTIFRHDNLKFVKNVLNWITGSTESLTLPVPDSVSHTLPLQENLHSHFSIDTIDTNGPLSVQQWPNSGYHASHLIQPDCSKQPFLTSQEDQRFVRFDGENDILINQYWQLDERQFTIAIVFRQRELENLGKYPFHIGDHKNPTENHQMLLPEWSATDGVFEIAFGNGNDKKVTTEPIEGHWTLMLIFVDTYRINTRVRVNGDDATMSQEPGGAISTFTRMALGGLDLAIEHPVNNAPVDIAEFLLYDRYLATEEVLAVEEYLFVEHGI